MELELHHWDGCEHDERTCNDHLMQEDWDQGFCCTLPVNHSGPHRDDGFSGRDHRGFKYHQIAEWSYE